MAEDELKLRRQTERAARAEALVNDPLFQEAFGILERDIVRAWKDTAASDSPLRERHHALMSAVTLLRENLQNIINDGKVAQSILSQPKPTNRNKVA